MYLHVPLRYPKNTVAELQKQYYAHISISVSQRNGYKDEMRKNGDLAHTHGSSWAIFCWWPTGHMRS
jgi:hypothetical protein